MKIYIIFILSSVLLFSQNDKADSLITILNEPTVSDSIRIDVLNVLSKEYTSINISKNDSILKLAISLSKSTNNINGQIISYNNYGAYLMQIGNYDKALLYTLKAKGIQDSLNLSEGKIRTANNLGRVYNFLGQSDKAIESYLLSIQLLKKTDINHPQLPATHFYLGSAYADINEFDKSKYHYNEAKTIAKLVNFKTGIAIANSSLGDLANKESKYYEAISHFENALEFFKETKQQTNEAHTYLSLSSSFKGLKNYKKAIKYNDLAILIYENQGDNLRQLKTAYLNQSGLYKSLNNFESALEFLEKYYNIKDSIFSDEKVKTIEELKTKYETEKAISEKEFAEQETKLANTKTEKTLLYLLCSLTILGLSLLSFFAYSKRLKEKKRREFLIIELEETQKRLALEKQYRASELKALKSQMNPHFVFNALTSIQDYILTNEKDLASDYLSKFSDLVRRYLNYSDTLSITLNEEIESLKLYLELEKLRFDNDLNISITNENITNLHNIKIPCMLIQPYVENAIKHGLLHKRKDRKLSISFSKINKNTIGCLVIDNGIGREKSKLINEKQSRFYKSFALKATSSRLDLLNYKVKDEIRVKIKDLYNTNSEPKGTKVYLTIPIQKNESINY